MGFHLELRGPEGTQELTLGIAPLSIGWGPGNDVLVPRDPELGEQHCVIDPGENDPIAIAVDKRFPLVVNGARAHYHSLRLGDELQLGSLTIIVKAAVVRDATGAPAAPRRAPSAPPTVPPGTAPAAGTKPAKPRWSLSSPGGTSERPSAQSDRPSAQSDRLSAQSDRPSAQSDRPSAQSDRLLRPAAEAPARTPAPSASNPRPPESATTPRSLESTMTYRPPESAMTPRPPESGAYRPPESAMTPRPPESASTLRPVEGTGTRRAPVLRPGEPPAAAARQGSGRMPVASAPSPTEAPATAPRPASGRMPVAAPPSPAPTQPWFAAAPASPAPAPPVPAPAPPAPAPAPAPPAPEPAAPPSRAAWFRQPPAREPAHARLIEELLALARTREASDLHLSTDLPPTMRVNGELVAIVPQPLDEAALAGIARCVTTDEQHAAFERTGDLDFCHVGGGLRYRANLSRHRTGTALSFRIVKERIPTLKELGIPDVASKLTTFAQGLVLVTGPLGAGKTTTMISLVDEVNRTRPDHLITVEDPIEFLIPPVKCQVSQRELGLHTRSFESALRAALREDPDIIVIGDLRDYATARLAIAAAETGHLVFASMPTMNAMKSLEKLIDLFPASEQATVRTVVSESLRGIISQRLVPGLHGRRVAVVELLFNSIAIGNMIRDGKTAALKNAMQTGRSTGMRTLEWSLQELVGAKAISKEVAAATLES